MVFISSNETEDNIISKVGKALTFLFLKWQNKMASAAPAIKAITIKANTHWGKPAENTFKKIPIDEGNQDLQKSNSKVN